MSDNDPDDLVGERRFTLPINPDPVTRRLQAEKNMDIGKRERQGSSASPLPRDPVDVPVTYGAGYVNDLRIENADLRRRLDECVQTGLALFDSQSRDISSDPVDEQIIRAYFWDIKNRIVQFEGEPTVNWLVRDLINSLHGNPPDPEEFNRILALVKEGKGDD